MDVATFTVTVLNVDPVLTGTAGHVVNEGDPVTLAGLGVGLSDPGFDNPLNTLDPANGGEVAETFTGVMVDWGDGSPTDVVNVVDRVSGSEGVLTTAGFSHDVHYYADNGTYTVEVTLRDDDGSNVTRSFEIVVENVDPTLVLTEEMFVINEGQMLFVPGLGAFTDPAAANPLNPNGASDETFTYSIDWGDGETDSLQLPVSVVDGGAGVGKTGAIGNSHFYADNDPDRRYTIEVTLTDDDGGSHTQSFVITVNNVNPTIEPLTPGELIDDEWMPGIFVDAKDLEGDGETLLVVRFSDPGADEYEVWIDWGDKLALAEGDPRFTRATPVNSEVTADGVTLEFAYPYTGPPDPLHPTLPIEISVVVVDDDYLLTTGGDFVFDSEAVFLAEPGRSEPGLATITNPGTEQVNVAIDTTADVALLEFPPLDEVVVIASAQTGADTSQQTQDAQSGGGDQGAASERVWELRAVTPDGNVSQPFQLKPEVMNDLPALFARLPDGRYMIFLVRTENNTRRLVLDLYVRDGKPIDISDDSDSARDRPPTTEEGDLDPAAEQIEVDIEGLEGTAPAIQQGAGPLEMPPERLTELPRLTTTAEQRMGAGLLASAGLATTLTRGRPRGDYRSQVEAALENADQRSWNRLKALRRRPR